MYHEHVKKMGKEVVFYIHVTHPAQLFCLPHLLVSSFILFVIITDKKIKICLKNYLGMLYQNSAR